MITIKQLIQILEEIESKYESDTHICIQIVEPRTKKVIYSNYLQLGRNRANKTTVVNTVAIRKWCRDYLKEEVAEDNND